MKNVSWTKVIIFQLKESIFNFILQLIVVMSLPIYVLIIIGITVGALTGITGASGVLIVVPTLTLLGLTFKQAIGSSLTIDVITTTSVVFTYFKYKNVDLRIALLLGLGAVIGAQFGSAIAFATPDRYLEIAFTIFTSYMSYVSFKRSKGDDKNTNKVSNKAIRIKNYVLAFLLSILTGIVTGTIGASGGIIFIAIMMLLFSIDVKRMIGTATLSMFLSAISGMFAYISANQVDLMASVVIGLSSLTSGYFFARLANKLSPLLIYILLGSVFLIVSITEILRII
ncbi:sulfite exporter TauE/SafE family protein [Saccharolobus sp. A20]|uniref:sulfite exporter TauE/SafE family protein n=2 Tax=Sulfolobaceae TaxID=118883 RepID=UPI000A850BD5|nr:sulfite exporter TauE/SafE family protein [Sulfolobus sp. A20]